jgi:hypothetical protein
MNAKTYELLGFDLDLLQTVDDLDPPLHGPKPG